MFGLEYLAAHAVDVLVKMEAVLLLASVMVVGRLPGVGKEMGYTLGHLLDSCRVPVRYRMAIVAAVTGSLPVEGRLSLSAGLMDSMSPRRVLTELRRNTWTREEHDAYFAAEGRRCNANTTAAYLGSHHYYLWCPLEPAVIIAMGVLGVSYAGWVGLMWPVIVAVLVSTTFVVWHMSRGVEAGEPTHWSRCSMMGVMALIGYGVGIVAAICTAHAGLVMASVACALVSVWWAMGISTEAGYGGGKGWLLARTLDWWTLGLVAAAIVFATWVGQWQAQLMAVIKSHAYLGVASCCLIGYAASLILGSSSKFAAIAALLTKVFGLAYLPLFYAVEYAGYLLSPAHKCTHIACGTLGGRRSVFMGWAFASGAVAVATAILIVMLRA